MIFFFIIVSLVTNTDCYMYTYIKPSKEDLDILRKLRALRFTHIIIIIIIFSCFRIAWKTKVKVLLWASFYFAFIIALIQFF